MLLRFNLHNAEKTSRHLFRSTVNMFSYYLKKKFMWSLEIFPGSWRIIRKFIMNIVLSVSVEG